MSFFVSWYLIGLVILIIDLLDDYFYKNIDIKISVAEILLLLIFPILGGIFLIIPVSQSLSKNNIIKIKFNNFIKLITQPFITVKKIKNDE